MISNYSRDGDTVQCPFRSPLLESAAMLL